MTDPGLAAARAPTLAVGVTISAFDCTAASPVYLVEAGERRWRVGSKVKAVLEAADGRRDTAAIGRHASAATGRATEPAEVERILGWAWTEGLLEGSPPPPKRAPSGRMERVFLRMPLFGSGLVERLGRCGAPLVSWPAFAAVAVAGVAVRLAVYPANLAGALAAGRLVEHWWLFLALGLALGIVHEMGHASATVRFGRKPGKVGLAFYLIYPVFYSDVSMVWGLPRRQRAVVDAAGAYFQTALATLCLLLWLWRPSPTLLWTAILSDSSLLMILNPFLKMDGYWLVSDLAGLPNLRNQGIKALGSLVWPARWPAPKVPAWSLWLLRVYTALSVGFFAWIFATLARLPSSGAAAQWGALLRAGIPRLLSGEWGALPEMLVGLSPVIGLTVGMGFGLYTIAAKLVRRWVGPTS